MMNDLTPSEIEALTRAIGNTLSSENAPKSPYDTPDTKKASRVAISNVQFPQLKDEDAGAEDTGKFQEKLKNLEVKLEVVLGRAKIPIYKLLEMKPGTVMTLDKLAGEKVDIECNGKLIAQGEVVIVEENFGVKISEIFENK